MREISPDFTKSVPNWRSVGISGHAAMDDRSVLCIQLVTVERPHFPSPCALNRPWRTAYIDKINTIVITMVLILSRVVK